MGNCCIQENSENFNLLTSLNKRNEKMKLLVREKEEDGKGIRLSVGYGDIFRYNKCSNTNLEIHKETKKQEEEDNFNLYLNDDEIEKISYQTEIKKYLANNEKVQAAQKLIDDIKLSSNDLIYSGNVLTEPENFPDLKINITSMEKDSKCLIKENSNCMSGEHSPMLDKVIKSNNRYSNCNYNANRLDQIYDFETTNANGNCPQNSEVLEKTNTFPEFKENSTLKHKSIKLIKMNNSMNSPNSNNSSKIKKKIFSANNDEGKITSRAEKFLTKSTRDNFKENLFRKNTFAKKISLIESDKKRSTIKSEISNISSYRVDKSGNFAHVQKVKEFQNIINKPKMDQTNSNQMKNYSTATDASNKKFKLNNIIDEYNTNNLTNHISINKYKFIFSDVDTKLNQKIHNHSLGGKYYNSYNKEKEEVKNLNMTPSVRDFSEYRNQKIYEKNGFIANKIANLSNILI